MRSSLSLTCPLAISLSVTFMVCYRLVSMRLKRTWKSSFQNIKLLQFEKKLHCSSSLLRRGPEAMCSNCRKGNKTAEEPLLHLMNFLMNSRGYQCSGVRLQQDGDRSVCPEGSARRQSGTSFCPIYYGALRPKKVIEIGVQMGFPVIINRRTVECQTSF